MALYNPQTTSSPQQAGGDLQSTSGLTVQPAAGASLIQPTVNPQDGTSLSFPSGGGDTGTVDSGGGGGEVAYADPYAAWGGKAAYDSLAAGFNTQDQSIHQTADESANAAALTRHSSILDWLSDMRRGQRGIDERGVQNELAKKQGYNSIVDMLGRGLRSGGTLLANKNALSSSAAEAIARAYGDFGNREMGKVGNQYELENRGINLAQTDLADSKATGLRKFGESEVAAVQSIVSEARGRLAELDAAMAGANMQQRIQIEQEKAQIQGSVQNILGQYDAELNSGAAGINPTSVDDRRKEAFGMANNGVAANNPFDFTSQAPAEFQNTGPFNSELPIFSNIRNKRQTA